MEKWEYKSLEWIHRVREENYEKTKQKPWSVIIQESNKEASQIAKSLNLEIAKEKGVKS